jgi:hypothetical protein
MLWGKNRPKFVQIISQSCQKDKAARSAKIRSIWSLFIEAVSAKILICVDET